jgi:hypothetical protein
VSATVTLKLHAAVLPEASVAVQVTGVVPTEKLPAAGTQTTLAPGQLSLTVALKLTVAEQVPASALVLMSAGQPTTGASVSLTVTVKLHVPVLPALSVAEQLTVVVPTPNVPGAGEQLTVTLASQLSSPVAVKLTEAEHWPASAEVVMLAGQAITGASSSLTVTLNVQFAVRPEASVAVQFTGVVPTLKVLPEAGEQTTPTPGQLSLALAANVTTAEH